MNKVIKIIGIVTGVFLILLFVVPLFVKKEYEVTREMTVQAEKETVMDFMRNFKNFKLWSPWAELDPNMKEEITGNDGEVGAKYYWKGNDDVGEGSMVIESISDNEIVINLTFIEPFSSESPTVYSFEEFEYGTTITWHMKGEIGYPWNGILLFMDMEKAIGEDLTKGLQNLRRELLIKSGQNY